MRLYSEDATIVDWLRRRLPSLGDGGEGRRTYVLACSDGSWTLREDGVDLGEPVPRDRVLIRLLERLNQIACFTDVRLSVHSGLVADELGRGIWLPASSGGGKTTLTAQLTLSGLRYATDEVVAVRGDGALEGWAKWLSVKAGSQGVLSSLAPDPDDPVGRGSAWFVPPDRVGVIARGPVAPVIIALPTHVSGAVTEVETISKARAVAEIVPQTFNMRQHGSEGIDTLALAAAQARTCVRITYDDGWDAARVLLELLHSAGDRTEPPQSRPDQAAAE